MIQGCSAWDCSIVTQSDRGNQRIDESVGERRGGHRFEKNWFPAGARREAQWKEPASRVAEHDPGAG